MSLLLSALCATMIHVPDVHFTDCSIDPKGRLLDARFVNVDADDALELVMAIQSETGERELRIHELDSRGALVPEPARTIPVLKDVVAWTFCDVREEPGPELVFLTPHGAHSMSLTLRGMRGNLKRWAREELVFRVPDTRRLDYWPWLLERAPYDWLVLPGLSAMTVRASDPEEGSRVLSQFLGTREVDESVEDGNELEVSGGGVRVQFEEAAAEDFLLPGKDRPGPVFLSDSGGYEAPGLGDLDGDGLADLIALQGKELLLLESTRAEDQKPRRAPLPDYLKDADPPYSLTLQDLDGDGDCDLLARSTKDSEETLGNGEHTVLVLLNNGDALLPEVPTQVLKFSASRLRLHIADVNSDGIPDLFTRTVMMPSLTTLVTGLRFTLTTELHFGVAGRGFERKAALKETRTFDEESIGAAIAQRDLSQDCSGDGIADLVEVDLSGRIAIRRLTRDSGFFTGETWELERDAWKRFQSRGSILALRVEDWNGDGIGDIMSYDKDRLALYLSRRSGGGR